MIELPAQPRLLSHWIDNATAPPAGVLLDRLSPGHGVPVSRVVMGTVSDVDRAVASSRRAFDDGHWPFTSAGDRAALLLKVAQSLRRETESLAVLETLESGKPVSQARMEVGWAAGLWEYAAGLARTLHGDSSNHLGATTLAFTLRDPIGVIAMITPWNFPLLILSQKLPFALAAGCTCVVKPSEMTSATTLRLGETLAEAGLPAGVVNIVTGAGEPVGRRLSEHPDVDMVSFTGSTAVGRSIARAAAGTLKKVALELGGKNPMIVCRDADLEGAIDAARTGGFFNMGECCNASSRLLVDATVADAFVEQLCARVSTLTVGDPLLDETKLGPIVNEAQERKILGYLAAAQSAGARICLGGHRLSGLPGRFIAPTVIDGVPPESPLAREEIFGPILSIVRISSLDEAIRMANATEYGLSAGIWTRDIDAATYAARRLRAGTVWVNTWLQGHAELSFGGYKQSGLGRELGRGAVEEYTEAKSVVIEAMPRRPWW